MKCLPVLAALLAALTSSGLEAQTLMTAKIPFDFQIGSSVMPAGEYRIQYSPNVLLFQSETGHHSKYSLVTQKDRTEPANTGVLEFRCYGSACFFAAMWTPNSTAGAGPVRSNREKELASHLGSPKPTQLALNSR